MIFKFNTFQGPFGIGEIKVNITHDRLKVNGKIKEKNHGHNVIPPKFDDVR